MSKPPAQQVNGLIDGIAVLQELATSPGPVAGKVIAEKLGLSPIRVNRLLKTLAYLGITYQDASRRYAVGAGMHVLAAQSMAASGLLRHALPCLSRLSEFGKTVALGVLWKDKVCYLYHKAPDVDTFTGLNGSSPHHVLSSSIGMALLASRDCSREELADLLAMRPDIDDGMRKPSSQNEKSPSRTNFQKQDLWSLSTLEKTGDFDSKHSKTLISNLVGELGKIKRQGYSEVLHHDHISMAVPIGDPPYAGVAVTRIVTEKERLFFRGELKKIAKELGA